jgi:hypothetical protein
VALVDSRTGLISREWYLFFQGVFDRIGGPDGPSIPDVDASLFEDAGNGETNAMLFTAEQALAQLPPDSNLRYGQYTIDVLTEQVASLREQIAVLLSEVQAIKQSTSL